MTEENGEQGEGTSAEEPVEEALADADAQEQEAPAAEQSTAEAAGVPSELPPLPPPEPDGKLDPSEPPPPPPPEPAQRNDPPPPLHLAPPEARAQDVDLPPPASVPLPQPGPELTVLPTAEVNDISPAAGPTIGGTRVTIEGKHLYRETIVRFGGELATTVGASVDRQLKVEAPPHKGAGTVDITLQNPGSDLSVVEKAFRYEPLPAPVITSVAPVRGAVGGGTELSITGKNFVATSVVKLGGELVDLVVFVNSTVLEVKTLPGKADQMIDVAVENPDGKRDVAPRAFKYDERY